METPNERIKPIEYTGKCDNKFFSCVGNAVLSGVLNKNLRGFMDDVLELSTMLMIDRVFATQILIGVTPIYGCEHVVKELCAVVKDHRICGEDLLSRKFFEYLKLSDTLGFSLHQALSIYGVVMDNGHTSTKALELLKQKYDSYIEISELLRLNQCS